jgi:hypothetical protein
MKMVLFLVLLGGCGLLPAKPVLVYDGPARPLDQVAVFGEASSTATLNAINGKPQVSFLKENRRAKGYHVLPGVYVLKLASQIRAFPAVAGVGPHYQWEEAEVTLEAKAGHTYMPRAVRMPTGQVRIWMEDMGTNFDQECLGVLGAGTFSRC